MPLNPAEEHFFTEFDQQHPAPASLDELSIDEFRQLTAVFNDFAGEPAAIDYRDETIACRDGHELPIRIFRDSDETKPLIIFFPGCGFVLDLFESNAVALSRIAAAAECHAVLVGFRLAPEHRFPAAYDDALEATQYIFDHAEQFSADRRKIIVAGFSSGACLAAAVCNTLRGSNQYPVYHQLLIDGCFDLTLSLDSHKATEKYDYLLTPESAKYQLNFYCDDPGQQKDPHCSPYWQKEFAGLPPTTILTPEFSGVRSHSENYYQRLHDQNIDVTKIIIPGQTHNTIICRDVMSDGEDPAKIAGDQLKKLGRG